MGPVDLLHGCSVLDILANISKRASSWDRTSTAPDCGVHGLQQGLEGERKEVAFQDALPGQQIMCGKIQSVDEPANAPTGDGIRTTKYERNKEPVTSRQRNNNNQNCHHNTLSILHV